MAYVRPAAWKKERTTYYIEITNGRKPNGAPNKINEKYRPEIGMTEKQAIRAAQRYADELEREIKNGSAIDMKTTFSTFADNYLERKKPTLAHNTMLNYRRQLERINLAIGSIELRNLRKEHIERFLNNLRERGVRSSEHKAAATRLAPMLKEKKITNKKLAELSGLNEATVSVAVKGSRVTLESAQKIATALDVSVETLFIISKNTSPLSEKTIREHLTLIRLVLEDAVENRYIEFNPARIKMPKRKKPVVKTLQPNEVRAIINAVDNSDIPLKWRVITHLLLATGCRRGEVIGLRWSKINFKTGTIRIDSQLLSSKEKGLYERPTKTGNERDIDMPDATMQLLKEYREEYEQYKASCGELWQRAINDKQLPKELKWRGSDFLFTQAEGWPMHPDSVNTWMTKFTKKNNLPHIHPHQYRHTAASTLLHDGNDVVSVAQRLGHAQVSTTLDTYAHPLEDNGRMKDTVSRLIYGG